MPVYTGVHRDGFFIKRMKKSLLSLILTYAMATTASAQYTTDGFYRIQNLGSERYAYLTDNTGSYDMVRDQGDINAVQMWSTASRSYFSDPSSLIYIQQVGASLYDLKGQGMSLHQLTNEYVTVRETSTGSGEYYVYATKSGVSKYLGDSETADLDKGNFSTSAQGDNKLWYVHQLDNSSSDNYFGLKPIVCVADKHYYPLYIATPFYLTGDMKAYTIKTVGHGMAVISEVTGLMPAFTPLLIECTSDNAIDNKIDLVGAVETSPLAGNLLSGVLFCNESRATKDHTGLSEKAITQFNPATMRLLGITSEGRLGFVSTSDQLYDAKRVVGGAPLGLCLPANQAYLPVPEGTEAEVTIVTQEEYDDFMSAIGDIKPQAADAPLYNLNGVRTDATKHGIYIKGGKKYTK